ncbi:MAG: Holliday junction resolvase RuvX [Clostridia bacterium]|nr:Holliday junction resolvase RuvX [Clostridia bacterium]MDD4146177.1 Holliday junction resolvase RuvX [Clostridia bacterium]MDD4665562.1 Holliday junction resolvase RuvX [Clostridia bacterium]
MRILGMDLGEKRIGLAVSDELVITAQGLPTLKRKEIKEDLQQLVEIIKEKQISKLVVGLPKNMNGTLGFQAEKVKKFVDLLIEEYPLEVVYWDERLTTVAAQRTLLESDVSRKKRKKAVDRIAAVMILQGYLNRMKY